MVQIKPPQKRLIFDFQNVQIGRGGTKYLAPPCTAKKLLWIRANLF